MDKPESESSRNGELRKTNIIDYVVVIARNRKFIVRFVGATLVLSTILLFLVLPRWYKSTAVVMPPKEKNALGLITSISRATAPLRSLGLGAGTDDLSQFQVILSSRRVMEAVINRFDLKSVYRLKSMEKAVKELEDNSGFTLGKEFVSIEITVFDTDPQRAADMANFFVEALNKTYLEMSVAEARSNREFIERRLTRLHEDLHNAEEAFKRYQEQSPIVVVPEQSPSGISAVAELYAMKVKKEIELGILEQSSTSDNPLVHQLRTELHEIAKKVDLIPEAGVQSIRLYREVAIQQKILEYVLPLYEQAKIEEQRNTPSVITLDTAVPAERPAKPKRVLTIAIIGIISFVLAYFIAMIMDALARARVEQTGTDREKLQLIRQELNIKRLFR